MKIVMGWVLGRSPKSVYQQGEPLAQHTVSSCSDHFLKRHKPRYMCMYVRLTKQDDQAVMLRVPIEYVRYFGMKDGVRSHDIVYKYVYTQPKSTIGLKARLPQQSVLFYIMTIIRTYGRALATKILWFIHCTCTA